MRLVRVLTGVILTSALACSSAGDDAAAEQAAAVSSASAQSLKEILHSPDKTLPNLGDRVLTVRGVYVWNFYPYYGSTDTNDVASATEAATTQFVAVGTKADDPSQRALFFFDSRGNVAGAVPSGGGVARVSRQLAADVAASRAAKLKGSSIRPRGFLSDAAAEGAEDAAGKLADDLAKSSVSEWAEGVAKDTADWVGSLYDSVVHGKPDPAAATGDPAKPADPAGTSSGDPAGSSSSSGDPAGSSTSSSSGGSSSGSTSGDPAGSSTSSSSGGSSSGSTSGDPAGSSTSSSSGGSSSGSTSGDPAGSSTSSSSGGAAGSADPTPSPDPAPVATGPVAPPPPSDAAEAVKAIGDNGEATVKATTASDAPSVRPAVDSTADATYLQGKTTGDVATTAQDTTNLLSSKDVVYAADDGALADVAADPNGTVPWASDGETNATVITDAPLSAADRAAATQENIGVTDVVSSDSVASARAGTGELGIKDGDSVVETRSAAATADALGKADHILVKQFDREILDMSDEELMKTGFFKAVYQLAKRIERGDSKLPDVDIVPPPNAAAAVAEDVVTSALSRVISVLGQMGISVDGDTVAGQIIMPPPPPSRPQGDGGAPSDAGHADASAPKHDGGTDAGPKGPSSDAGAPHNTLDGGKSTNPGPSKPGPVSLGASGGSNSGGCSVSPDASAPGVGGLLTALAAIAGVFRRRRAKK